MESLYFLFLIIHIFCAIIFIGYLFLEVVVLSKINFKPQIFKNKIIPLSLVLLVISGFFMIHKWLGSDIGYFDLAYQKIFILKIFLAFLIFVMIFTNLFFQFVLKRQLVFKNIHILVLFLSIIIILCAKLIYYV